jgi:hypothetical protein
MFMMVPLCCRGKQECPYRARESNKVLERHLRCISQFLSGKVHLSDEQLPNEERLEVLQTAG